MFVWMAKFGAAYGVRTGIHVGVDVLVNRAATAGRAKYVILFGLFCGALFTGDRRHDGRDVRLSVSSRTDRPRPTWSCRRGSCILCVPLGSYLMCFRFLQVAWAFWRTGELPHTTRPRRGRAREPAGSAGDARRATARHERAIIFGLLIALMLTGMPISIALGLTVLTFLFTMTDVPIEAVALKLFTGIEKFEIMAIPFFILAGNFLTHGGVAQRMIAFRHLDGRPLVRRPRARRRAWPARCSPRCRARRRRPSWRSARSSCRRWCSRAFPKRFGAGVITTSGALGILIPPSIVMVIYAVATGGTSSIRRQRVVRSVGSCSSPASFRA